MELTIIGTIVWLSLLVQFTNQDMETALNQQIIQEYQQYCPYTDQCKTEANLTNTPMFDEYPCCEQCVCSKQCKHTRSCCPDAVSHFVSPEEIQQINTNNVDCVKAGFETTDSYKMVAKCPVEYEDEDVAYRCERSYEKFDFNKDSLNTLPPLTSLDSGVIYKNAYCGRCHNVDMRTTQMWSSKLTCEIEPLINDIATILTGDNGCSLDFHPPDGVNVSSKRCISMIYRCNMTGNWKHYDLKLESACLSYLSVYKHYKNVHCFLCNGHSVSDIKHMCYEDDVSSKKMSSFIALLDFNNLVSDSGDSLSRSKLQQCEPSSVYDVVAGICRKMICPHGFRLNGRTCLPVFKDVFSERGTVIEIPFILVPFDSSSYNNVNFYQQIVSSMMNTTHNYIGLIGNVKITALNIYIRLNTTREQMQTDMALTNSKDIVTYFRHLEFMLQVNFLEIHNTDDVIQRLARLFVENEYFSTCYIRHKQLDYRYNDVINDNSVNTRDLVPLRYNEESKATFIVQPRPFAPRIELGNDEYDIDIITKSASRISVENNYKNVTPETILYNFTSMIQTSTGKSVLVCVDELLAQNSELTNNHKDNINTPNQAERESGEESVLSIICLLISIISLSFTFIVYCLLPQLRTPPGMNIMSLSLTLIILHVCTLTNSVIDLPPLSVPCQVIGVLEHVSLLSVFSWMFVCTNHMMRVFLTIKGRNQVSDGRNVFIRYVLFTVFVPLSVIVLTIIVSVSSGNGIGYGGKSCYIKHSMYILICVAIPLAVVVIANVTMFSVVTATVIQMPHIASSTKKERNNLLIFLKLSSLTGFTWIFGFVYELTKVSLFANLFIICNAGQGFFIMISFVANQQVFRMLRGKSKYSLKSSSGKNGTTVTNSTEMTTDSKI